MGESTVCEDAVTVDLMGHPDSEHTPEPDIDLCPSKEQAKEVSHEDIRSEVTNPIVSPKENTSTFHDVTSQPFDIVCSSNQAALLDDTSVLSGNSSSTGTVSDASPTADTSLAVSTSHVTLEIPKHLSSTGITKITFKFSKKKEDYESRPFDSAVGNASVECCSSSLCAPNMELKMSKKVFANNYPTNVKKLLATGILDGARVKYIYASPKRELPGIIHGGGYLCGCSSCDFSKVLSAYEFELHAGAKTRHPNNHIYLENGKPVYNIIQEIKTAPLSVLDEVVKAVAGSSINETFFQNWKASLQRGKEVVKAAKKFDTDSPHSATKSAEGSMSISSLQSQTLGQEGPVEMLDWRHIVKKPNSNFTNPTAPQKRTADGGTKKRDNDLHRLLFMPNGLPDGAELAYYVKGHRLLKGYKQGNGIVCDCCDKEVSPSQFEAHAGMAARRQPYRHIYTSNGLTLHDIALSLANGQRLTSDVSDDMCAICGGGGDLLLCCECPQAFHMACLNLQSLPEPDWICPNCSNSGRGRKAISGDGPSRPIVIRLNRVVKAPELEPGGCAICRAHDFSSEKFDDRTVILCDQCEREYHVGCLRDSKQCELKGIPEDKWFCCDDCSRIHLALQSSVSNGLQTISSSLLNTIRKKHMEKRLIFTDENADFVQWRILSGKSRSPEHMPLLSGAAAIFRECFDPIVAKSGRDLIPLMVYGRNISGQEFGGMYCVVLIVGSVVVSAGLLRLFGCEVAELPLVATSRACQGNGYFQALFSCIERLLSSMKVGKLVLPAAEEALSIWTKKFGFKKMNDEQMIKYQTGFQLTVFKGTSMLEKEVPVSSE